MRRLVKNLVVLAALGAAAAYWVTAPKEVNSAAYGELTPDAVAGEAVFTAAGCASCHAPSSDEHGLVLAGGQAFASDFGVFYAPNISSDPVHGIGAWSLPEFANALTNGVSPDGQHYYPAFPYTAYGKMTAQDVVDLWAYMITLPADATPSKAHEVGFPFNIRRSLGGWKLLFDRGGWAVDAPTPELERGRYLVEALAHCGECHTPRNALGGLKLSDWLAGAPNPSGQGRVPDLTAPKMDWSAEEISDYLESGFTPEFDSAGGHMVPVIENFAKLPASDRAAVAAYIKALP